MNRSSIKLVALTTAFCMGGVGIGWTQAQGTLRVKKLDPGQKWAVMGLTFPVTVSCNNGNTYTLTLIPGGPQQTIPPQNVGTKCTVTENPPNLTVAQAVGPAMCTAAQYPGHWVVTYSKPSPVTISVIPKIVSITNQYQC